MTARSLRMKLAWIFLVAADMNVFVRPVTAAVVLIAASWFASPADASTLPGFRVTTVAQTNGYLSSLVFDSHGTIYYTSTAGTIYRLENGQSVPVASVVTDPIGNSGLLGMALVDDHTAVVHYTMPQQTYDVISRIDLTTGAETIIHQFADDIELPGRGVNPEHHGGNPIVARDGSIYFAIGDALINFNAPKPEWNIGKIWRINPDSSLTQMARGTRNVFDLAYDEEKKRVIFTDNGPVAGDELNIIDTPGNDYGWPYTYGDQPPVEGTVPPIYVFPDVSYAPTGLILLNGRKPLMRKGVLIGAFVTRALYYFPNIDTRPFPGPIAIMERESGPVVDVAQTAEGEIYFAAGTIPGDPAHPSSTIYKITLPLRGDCNGDGIVNPADLTALQSELNDGVGESAYLAQEGAFSGTWGCDANVDGVITAADAVELSRLAHWRRRAVQGR